MITDRIILTTVWERQNHFRQNDFPATPLLIMQCLRAATLQVSALSLPESGLRFVPSAPKGHPFDRLRTGRFSHPALRFGQNAPHFTISALPRFVSPQKQLLLSPRGGLSRRIGEKPDVPA